MANSPSDQLAGLSEYCSGLSRRDVAEPVARVLELTIRCCLFCIGLGNLDESAMGEGLWRVPAPGGAADIMQAVGQAVYQGTVAAAVDLDPMSVGPAHLALPATVATLVASDVLECRSDEAIADAVLAGIEAGSRIRAAVPGGRPGTGFHSAGTLGTVAAAASVARLMGLGAPEFANAIGIAFTRMSGLAINAAHTRICLTHFGWAAAHGLEAAWLARNGWGASLDVVKALRAVFPDSSVDLTNLQPRDRDDLLFGADSIIFKRYPCNAYLNPVVIGLSTLTSPVDRVEVRMPSIAHLNRPNPQDVREARYSVQAVAAISVLYPHLYESFSEGVLMLGRNPELQNAMDQVTVVMDDRPTNLAEASVEVTAWAGGSQVLNASEPLRQLTPWSEPHATALLEGRSTSWIARLYALPYREAYRLATDQAALAGRLS